MTGFEKYLGVPYRYGTTDCFTTVRNFYKEELGLTFPNYARYSKFWEEGWSMWLKYLPEEGFYLLDDLEEPLFGDLYIIALGASVGCHGAIYIGNNLILHHPVNRLSCIDKYKGLWKNRTVGKYRHISLKERLKHEIKKQAL